MQLITNLGSSLPIHVASIIWLKSKYVGRGTGAFSGHILTAIGERKSLEKVLGSLCGTISVFRGAEHRH
jgi:hypothetical protein